jgi:hypothetical protein
MKDAILFTLAAVLAFVILSDRRSDSYTEDSSGAQPGDPVPPDVIQALIEKVQESDPDIVPLETLFINAAGGGDYTARFMFFNSRTFTGSQIDVRANASEDGTVRILSMTATARPTDRSFEADKYKTWDSIQDSLDGQLMAFRPPPAEGPKSIGPAPYDATLAAENLKTK